ncbi:MAG: thioredoxin family protein [Candidatus Kapaibacteriales bacterium]
MRLFLLFIFILAQSLTLLAEQAKVDSIAPDFTLPSVKGKEISLSNYKDKIVVLEWINFDCPYVRKHYETGNIPKMQQEYTNQDIIWLGICSSAPGKQGHLEKNEILERINEYNAYFTEYLIDETGKVGKTYGAKTTPHYFIIDKNGLLVYSGAIDDKPNTNKEDIATARNYVRDVLNALLSQKTPPLKVTKPYGCSVKY